MGLLQDKVMVITGSSRGLGLAVAQAAAAEGAKAMPTIIRMWACVAYPNGPHRP